MISCFRILLCLGAKVATGALGITQLGSTGVALEEMTMTSVCVASLECVTREQKHVIVTSLMAKQDRCNKNFIWFYIITNGCRCNSNKLA